jgi:hypothetical protein
MLGVSIKWISVRIDCRTNFSLAEIVSRTNHGGTRSVCDLNQPIFCRRNEAIEFGLIHGRDL